MEHCPLQSEDAIRVAPAAGHYRISEVGAIFGIHPQTLREYERSGLLSPARSRGNTRLYSDADLERLREILELTREQGVNLVGVEMILRLRERVRVLSDDRNQEKRRMLYSGSGKD